MKTQTVFQNSSLVSVVNGSIIVKSAAGIEHTFINASVVFVNNGTIIIESEWEPKKGELVKITGQCIDAYSILDKIEGDIIYVFGWKKLNCDRHELKSNLWLKGSQTKISPVTPKEQKHFDDFCKSQGMFWNAETLKWEDYKWSPKPGEQYWYAAAWGGVISRRYINTPVDQGLLQLGNAFPTKEKAEKVAAKVTQLFKSL